MKNEEFVRKYLPFAKTYLKLGWTMLPMQFIKGEDGKMKKQPMVKWKIYQDRQPTLEEVTYWLEQGWFLGIITGKVSGIVIIDDDRIKHGLNPTTLDSTIIAKTKSGGTHYYYKYDRLVTNHANSELFVDLRGEGGYCVLPPFNEYQWIKSPKAEAIANLPTLSVKAEEEIAGTKKTGTSEKISLTEFENIWDGERNQTMYQLACSTWNNPQLTEREKILQIEWLNETRCRDKDGNNHPLNPSELQTLINSAKTFVEQNPKDKFDPKKEELDRLPIPVPRDLSDVVKERMWEKEIEKNCAQTGYYSLDKMVKGFLPGHLYTLTGDTNVGKTSLACNFAVNVAKQGKKVLYLALEPDCTVVDYLASVYHRLPFEKLVEEHYNFADIPIKVYDKKQVLSPDHLVKTIKSLERYDLIIIDHIGYFIKDTNNTNQEQSNVIKMLAGLAREKKCAILQIAHIRKSDGRAKKNKIITMDDISGSASFKQDSTDVWLVAKHKDPADPLGVKYLDTGYLLVGKSKSSGNGAVKLKFAEKSAFVFELMDLQSEMASVEAIDGEV